jgi:hypothetical protein
VRVPIPAYPVPGYWRDTSAVRPAWVTGRKLPPRPLVRVVFFPFEAEHVVTQQDERVGAGACAGDMTVVVDIPGRDQRGDVSGTQLVQLSQEVADGAGKSAGAHLTTLMGTARG